MENGLPRRCAERAATGACGRYVFSIQRSGYAVEAQMGERPTVDREDVSSTLTGGIVSS